MSTDLRALCAELLMALENAISIIYCEDGTKHISTAKPIVNRARAALADEPAVPDGREPAAVTRQLSDEELLKLAQQYSVVYLRSDGSACHPFQEGHDMRNDVLNFARAVLARWGTSNLTQARLLPADGEVAEVMGLFRHWAEAYPDSVTVDPYWLTRAADLLQRLNPPQPVPVSERLPGPEDCDAEGRCWWGRSESHDWSADWTFATYKAVAEFCEFSPRTTWLPAHALPLPEVGE